MMWTRRFWIDATERAIRTGAQMLIGLSAGAALNVLVIDWVGFVGLILGAMLLSYATSLVSTELTKSSSASLVEAKLDGGK